MSYIINSVRLDFKIMMIISQLTHNILKQKINVIKDL